MSSGVGVRHVSYNSHPVNVLLCSAVLAAILVLHGHFGIREGVEHDRQMLARARRVRARFHGRQCLGRGQVLPPQRR